LTAAQEEALYREGTIPPPAEAESFVAKLQESESTQLPTSEGGDIQNPGHKFGLPKKPYPEGFNMKQRYHPVLEQLTRLLMRDGKLSVAQRVRFISATQQFIMVTDYSL
jgi:small subunit ribosomal protein S7